MFDPVIYQYFCHLWHDKNLVEFDQYRPLENWDMPQWEIDRFKKLFSNLKYICNQRILDLGCSDGYLSYTALKSGAHSVHGIDIREWSVQTANYACKQLGEKQFQFEVGDIENQVDLAKWCQHKDTVILTRTLQQTKNPYLLLETLTNSDVKFLIFESHIFDDDGRPSLEYLKKPVSYERAAYTNDNSHAIIAVPNAPWIYLVLYHLGWKIEFHDISYDFNPTSFATLGSTPEPYVSKDIIILASKNNSL